MQPLLPQVVDPFAQVGFAENDIDAHATMLRDMRMSIAAGFTKLTQSTPRLLEILASADRPRCSAAPGRTKSEPVVEPHLPDDVQMSRR